MMENTLNLISILEEKGQIKATITHDGYIDGQYCYYDPGSLEVIIYPNNLSGGYIGNTLLIPASQSKALKSHLIIQLGELTIFKAALNIKYENKLLTIKKRYNFLKINAVLI